MYSVDKIKYHVGERIINIINECVKLQKVEVLRKWLADCNHEISRRQEAEEDTYPLFYEKEYLEMVLR